MKWGTLAAAMVGLLSGAGEPEDRGAADAKQLQGTWALVSMKDRETGRNVPVGDEAGYFQLRFEGNAVEVREGGTRISGGEIDGQGRRINWMAGRGQAGFALVGDTLTIYLSTDRDSVVPFFTSFGGYSQLRFRRETPDTPHVAAIDRECKELEGTWRLLYRLPESEAAKEWSDDCPRPVFPPSWPTDLRQPANQCFKPPPLLSVFKGRKVRCRQEGVDGGEELDLWVNPRITPKRIEMGAIGIEYGGTYELKGDLLRIRRPGGDESEEAVVDLWRRQK